MSDSIGRITNDLRNAMKAGDALRLSTLRMLMASIQNRAIEKRGQGRDAALTDEETLQVIRSEVKKRKDAITEFQKAGRADRAKKEAEERAVLETYLPAELSDGVLEEVVRAALASFGTVDSKDFGKAMGAAMRAVAGRASGERVRVMVERITKSIER